MTITPEKKSDGNWVSKNKLTLKGNPPKIDLGFSMVMSNDTLVLGSSHSGKNGYRSGSANVFKRTSTGWLHTTELLPKIGKKLSILAHLSQ